jgi:hypothetical protein
LVVTQAEINLILGKTRRRMMRLPISLGPCGEHQPCPVREGCSYQLQSRAGSKGQATITIVEVYPEKLAAITLADARREGYAGIQGALDAWTRTHHKPSHDESVWVILFAKDKDGDTAAFLAQKQPVYLARYGDYTTRRDNAIPGEAEVLTPFAEDLANARTRALEHRVSPQREALKRAANDAETLQQSIQNMKARTLIKRAQRNYEAAERLLLSAEDVHSTVSAAADGSPGEADRPPRSVVASCSRAA